MIINKNDYTYQTRSDKPNENWMNENYYLLEDGTELANKFIQYYPYAKLTIQNNQIIDIEEDIVKKIEDQSKSNIENEILQLKQSLFDTDYQAIKYAEGWITEEEYAPTKTQRQLWRDEINMLENSQNEIEEENN